MGNSGSVWGASGPSNPLASYALDDSSSLKEKSVELTKSPGNIRELSAGKIVPGKAVDCQLDTWSTHE